VRQVAVIVRHFRCLQKKEARETAQKAVQKGRRGKERRGGGPGAGLGSGRLGRAYIGVRLSLREIRLEEGMNQSSEPAGRWDYARGPCETDAVTRAEFKRLGGPAG
jgi:hypothetical protein